MATSNKMTESKKKSVTAGTLKLHFMAALKGFQDYSLEKGTKAYFTVNEGDKTWQTLDNLLASELEKNREEPLTLRGNAVDALIGQILQISQLKAAAIPAAAPINGNSYDHVFIDFLLSLGLARVDAVGQSKSINDYLKSIAWFAARQIYTDSEQSAKKEEKKMTLTITLLQRLTLMLESSFPDKSAEISALADSFKPYEKVKTDAEALADAPADVAAPADVTANVAPTEAAAEASAEKKAKKSAKKEKPAAEDAVSEKKAAAKKTAAEKKPAAEKKVAAKKPATEKKPSKKSPKVVDDSDAVDEDEAEVNAAEVDAEVDEQ